jgi:hypothetical protein
MSCPTSFVFNEPDQKEQANLSREKAIERWPAAQKSGLHLPWPATAGKVSRSGAR